MAAAVAVPLSAINNELGGVLPPSALSNNNPRHGRSRGMSFKGGRGRRYSVVEERDTSIAKALMFVIKRAIQKEDADEEAEAPTGEYLVADAEGWISVNDLLAHSRITEYGTELDDVQRIVSNAIKARFELRQKPDTDADDAASWQILRITTKEETVNAAVPVGDKLTADDADLPEFIIYETSYQRYPLLLTLGCITRAPGGAEYHSFVPVDEEGKEPRQHVGEAAEVSVWINLKKALQTDSKIAWRRSDNGLILTANDVDKSLWKKAVARRPDIGLLFEDGEVKKEVPAGLRGKSAKGKGKKGDRTAFKREGSGEDSASGSEEQEE